jgi:hypothetical protein
MDPNFSDTLDALILVDLRSAPLPLLERSMGRPEAQAFVAQALLPAASRLIGTRCGAHSASVPPSRDAAE